MVPEAVVRCAWARRPEGPGPLLPVVNQSGSCRPRRRRS
jgi:hypothetical protein